MGQYRKWQDRAEDPEAADHLERVEASARRFGQMGDATADWLQVPAGKLVGLLLRAEEGVTVE